MRLKKLFVALFLVSAVSAFGQDNYIINQATYLQKSNSSYFGFNLLGRVGILYNSLKINDQLIDNKYAFASIPFQNKNFSLGFDVNFFDERNSGLRIGLTKLAYVYKIQLDSQTFLLPSIYVGFGNQSIDQDILIFADQLDRNTGFINSTSSDPIAEALGVVNYLDIGASFLLHSDKYLMGISLMQINRPDVSFNEEETFKKQMRIAVQGGYEFDINPLGFSFLPEFSYFYTFFNAIKEGDAIFVQFEEKFNMGEFNIGFSQQTSMVEAFNLNNIGLNLGLNLENFYFNVGYNFPSRNVGQVYSPSIFELSVIFDFSTFRRNNRGLYKSLQIDNYY